MKKKILLLSDIHGNYPALSAIEKKFNLNSFDTIINCGDSVVYAPFPNKTLEWLRMHNVISILGNTDRKVIKLLKGKQFKKPSKEEKRIMYSSTAKALNEENQSYLLDLPNRQSVTVPSQKGKKQTQTAIGIFHGSPDHDFEFLFNDTPDERFRQLARTSSWDIILTGHSHSPYHKQHLGTHFVNPGSVGRMFDGDPRLSCAILELSKQKISSKHYRLPYNIDLLEQRFKELNLPDIYIKMFKVGKKLN